MKSIIMVLLALILVAGCSAGLSEDGVEEVGVVEQKLTCLNPRVNGTDCLLVTMTNQKSCRWPTVKPGAQMILEAAYGDSFTPGQFYDNYHNRWPVCDLGPQWYVAGTKVGDHVQFDSTKSCTYDGWNWKQVISFPAKRGRCLTGAVNATRSGPGAPSCTESWLITACI